MCSWWDMYLKEKVILLEKGAIVLLEGRKERREIERMERRRIDKSERAKVWCSQMGEKGK